MHNNTIYSDIFGDILIVPTGVMDRAVERAIAQILTQRELDIAKRYYGIVCERQTLTRIGQLHSVGHENIRNLVQDNIRPKLSYLNSQKAIANAMLPYVRDVKTRMFLASIPEYKNDTFLPYRLDQMCFGDAYYPLGPLEEAGITTIGHFLAAETDGSRIRAFGPMKRRRVLGELNRFGIEPPINNSF